MDLARVGAWPTGQGLEEGSLWGWPVKGILPVWDTPVLQPLEDDTGLEEEEELGYNWSPPPAFPTHTIAQICN